MLRLNDPFNTYVTNEICQVYAFPISKSFREMEKIDRNVQHGDYSTLFSYSPRKQAAASVRYIVYQFAIQSSRSLECSLKLFHPNLVFASFAQFRVKAYTCIYAYMCIHIHIHPFPISLFRKSPLIHLARKRGCRATEIRRLRGFIRGEMQNISVRTKPRWKKKPYTPSHCPLLPRYSCEEIGDHFQITLVICLFCID